MQDLGGISDNYKDDDDSVRSFIKIYESIFETTEPDIYQPEDLIKLLFMSDNSVGFSEPRITIENSRFEFNNVSRSIVYMVGSPLDMAQNANITTLLVYGSDFYNNTGQYLFDPVNHGTQVNLMTSHNNLEIEISHFLYHKKRYFFAQKHNSKKRRTFCVWCKQ